MKPARFGRAGFGAGLLSPANCGGLIEAGLGGRQQRFPRQLSPANCGGLIEASSAAALAAAHFATFPRELRGPH